MSRFKELAKSSGYILGAQTTSIIISVVFIACFARIFSKAEMALFAFLAMLAAWMQVLGNLGLGTFALKEVAYIEAQGQAEGAKRLISSVVVYRSLGISIFGILFFIASDYITYYSFGDYEYAELVRFIVVIAYAQSINTVLMEIQVATQRFRNKAMIGVGVVLGQRAFCVIGFLLGGVYGFYGGFLTATLIGIFLAFRDIRSYLTYRLLAVGDMFRRCKGFIGLDLLNGSIQQIGQPIIAFFVGAEGLADYYIARRLYMNIVAAMKAILLPAGVKYGEVKAESQEVLRRYHNNILSAVAALFIPCGFVMVVMSKPLMLLFGGEKYLPVAPVAAAFGVTLMCLAFWLILREAGLRLIAPRYLIIQTAICAGVLFSSYGLLLPRFGIIGVPTGSALGYLAGAGAAVLFLRRQYDLGLPLKGILSALICGAVILLACLPFMTVGNLVFQIGATLLLSGGLYIAWMYFWGPGTAKTILQKVGARILKPFLSKRPTNNNCNS